MIRKFIHIVMLMLFLVLLVEKEATGQEFPSSLQYISNMHTLNPAFVGIWDQAGLMVSTRINWVGIGGAPVTQEASYFTPVKDQKSGLGLRIQRNNIGREKRMFFTGDYSYQVQVDMKHYLRFGLRAGIVNFDNNLLDYQYYPDHIPDPEATTDVRLYYMTVFGVGAVFYNNNYFISLSAPQFINNTFKVNRTEFASVANVKTVYLSGGYIFKMMKSIRFRPNLLAVVTFGKPAYFDLAALVFLPSDLQLGINLRTNGVACLSVQYTFSNNLRLGYASEYFIFPDIRKYQLGTYEIVVGYDFNLYRKKYAKPNYF